MTVLDSSILVGIIRGEPDAGQLLDLLGSEECAIGLDTDLIGESGKIERSEMPRAAWHLFSAAYLAPGEPR